MPTKKLKRLQGKTIRTAAGEALYHHTEVENVLGRFDDHWATRDGYWVIHEGKYHHVYEVRR
jgi:hypothetical protein